MDWLERYYEIIREESKGIDVIKSAKDIVKLSIDLNTLKYETIRVYYLDTTNKVLGKTDFKGIGNSCMPCFQRITKRALSLFAVSIILVHNHPGGTNSFSVPDYQFTRKAWVLFNILGITLQDHILLYKTGHLSMRTLPKWAADIAKANN